MSVKRHICDTKFATMNALPSSVNYIIIWPFRKDFIFAKFREHEILAKIIKGFYNKNREKELNASVGFEPCI